MNVKCKFEHDEDCCNSGSPQYMCKCKPDICHSAVPMTNADRIRSMSDEELAKWFLGAGICIRDLDDVRCDGVSCKECRLNWLRQPAEED